MIDDDLGRAPKEMKTVRQSPAIDDQINFGDLLHRKIGWFLAFENPV